jgi:hypothetical protein
VFENDEFADFNWEIRNNSLSMYLNTRSQAEITLYLHKIPGRNNPLSQYLNTRSQAEITIYFDKTISMEQQAKCYHKIRNIGGLVFRYGDNELFLPEILCLGTGIKGYFCLGSCLGAEINGGLNTGSQAEITLYLST